MPTYLAAFAICDYEHVSRTERGKEVSDGDPPGKGTFVLATDCSGTPALGAMPTDPTVPSWFSLWSPPSPVTTLSTELQNGMQRFPLRFCGRVSLERLLIKPTRGRFWAPPTSWAFAAFQSTGENRESGHTSTWKLRFTCCCFRLHATAALKPGCCPKCLAATMTQTPNNPNWHQLGQLLWLKCCRQVKHHPYQGAGPLGSSPLGHEHFPRVV